MTPPSRDPSTPLARRLVVELLGKALVLATVVGSRVMGERLSGGVVGLTFLVNSLATASVTVALLLAFAPVASAQLNPAVTFGALLRGRLTLREAALRVLAQLAGAFLGVGATLLIFGHPVFSWSNPPRATVAEVTGEFLSTFGLLCIVAGGARLRAGVSSFAVGAYLAALYWFTESTSFANPAVTVAKGLTATSSSIHPADISLILSAQLLGAACCALLFRWLLPARGAEPRRGPARLVFACTEGGALARLAVEAVERFADAAAVRAVAAEGEPLPDEALLAEADLLVTLGPADLWRALTDAERVHWELPLLTGLSPEAAQQVREEVRVRVRLLLRGLGLERVRAV
ncbi:MULTISPECIES: aquaporin [Myxococcaceae]|uniref:aquaporin n=1 Tax=Myxococcaceae TaxID=31 RepID=UPI00188F4F74|nr:MULTISPECIES: aquaporin [Myxococcaceae]MBF5045697.1 aquaporin [Simulacricoccus sp. 17bor-14]